MKTLLSVGVVASTLLLAWPALAQPDEPKPATTPPANAPDANPPPSPPAAAPDSKPDPKPEAQPDEKVVPPNAEERKEDLTPRPAEPPAKVRFTADPVGDTGVIALALTFGILSQQIISTGEIAPQQIRSTFQTRSLLGIDRGAISQTIDHNADQRSNWGMYGAIAYVAGDTLADLFREGKTAALVDAIMYAEAATITQAVTNLAKIAFRRPRPIAYINRNEFVAGGGNPADFNNADTDSSLSFFSQHTAQVAAMSAAATYVAFSRSPKTIRPWLTLGVGTALTTFVAYERVRGGNHFPTDVIAGALAGTAVGSLVVHLHREDSVKQRPVWIGMAPVPNGGVLSASGLF